MGIIAGIIVGAISGCIAVGLIGFLFYLYKKRVF